MDQFLIILLVIGFGLLVIAGTKALWQWVLGTKVLIEESKKQTTLLEKIAARLDKE